MPASNLSQHPLDRILHDSRFLAARFLVELEIEICVTTLQFPQRLLQQYEIIFLHRPFYILNNITTTQAYTHTYGSRADGTSVVISCYQPSRMVLSPVSLSITSVNRRHLSNRTVSNYALPSQPPSFAIH